MPRSPAVTCPFTVTTPPSCDEEALCRSSRTSYTYDTAGNITQLTDHGDTGAGRTVAYGYDDLTSIDLSLDHSRYLDTV